MNNCDKSNNQNPTYKLIDVVPVDRYTEAFDDDFLKYPNQNDNKSTIFIQNKQTVPGAKVDVYTRAFEEDYLSPRIPEPSISAIEELTKNNPTYSELFIVSTKCDEGGQKDSFETDYFQSQLLKYNLRTLGDIVLAVKNGNPFLRYATFPNDCAKLLCKHGILAKYKIDEKRIILPEIQF